MIRLLVFVLFMLTGATARPLAAQVILTDVPSAHFREVSVPLLLSGDLNEAAVNFNADLRDAVKVQGGYLDSICYWAYYGETDYQAGRYADALIKFNTALQIYFNNSDFLKNITVAGQPGQLPRPPLPWGVSERKGGIGNFKSVRFMMSHIHKTPVAGGKDMLGNQQIGEQQSRTNSPIHADDIVLSLSLTIRRRAELLGTWSKYDLDTKKLNDILAARPCLPNHFTGTWIDVLHGLTLSALRDDAAAETMLNAGLLMLQANDHQLTAAALNELGNIQLRKGLNPTAPMPAAILTAYNLFLEASFSAHQYAQPLLLGETFQRIADTQRLIDPVRRSAVIEPALTFFSQQRHISPFIMLPLLLTQSEYNINAGKIQEADVLLTDGFNRLRKTILLDAHYGATLNYLSATLNYHNAYATHNAGEKRAFLTANTKAGENFELAMRIACNHSLRLFQLEQLNRMIDGGAVNPKGPLTERIADERFAELLRESTDADWQTEPLECWTMMISVPPVMYERWFVLALQRGNKERAFDIAERVKKARFYAALPPGEARLSAFRQLLETPDEKLPQHFFVAKQMLQQRFKEYKRRSEKVALLKNALPFETDHLATLETESYAQELLLRTFVLLRIHVPDLFPPIVPLEQIRKNLPRETSMLVYAEALGHLYGFLVSGDGSLSLWEVNILGGKGAKKTVPPLNTSIGDYLKLLGNRSPGQVLLFNDLTKNTKWKEAGADLFARLLGNERRNTDFIELVIVPAGSLWYVPFETLCVKAGEQYVPLLTAGDKPLTVRYALTAGLVSQNIPNNSRRNTGLVLLGKLKSSDKIDTTKAAFDRMKKDGIKGLTAMLTDRDANGLPSDLPVSANVFTSVVPNLIVLDDVPKPAQNNNEYGVFGWTPFRNDKNKRRSPIATWLPLPHGGPQLLVLPAFHTAAEEGIKENKNLTGDEIFLSAMLLQSCGTDTILLSRWSTGGRSALDLVHQFLKRYWDTEESNTPAGAWRQAVLTVGSSPLNIDEEPRVKPEKKSEDDGGKKESNPLANHPFFWGGYLLISR